MAPIPFPPDVPEPQINGVGPPETAVHVGEISMRETKGKRITVRVGWFHTRRFSESVFTSAPLQSR